MQNLRTKAEKEAHKNKLAASYHELLEKGYLTEYREFSSKDLRTVGNYTLGRLLGKGSFGKVYLANHNLTNGTKVVLKSANKDDANLAREIHHHRQFVHPHIARLYEVIVTESLVWLVLEYCPGDELYNYLLHHGALPVEKVQRMFTQLVGAVSYIHNLNCVHRDLKLENILLDKNENIKLVDFGFTREYEGKQNYLQTFCGTVCYSAPEMLKGEKYAGEKVDVWSLGIILYALLAGELPFDEDDDLVTKHRILSQDPTYPDTFPEEAKTLIAKLLSKRPLLRPTLSEILADPFLKDHAPNQQAILKLARPPPFTTPLETDVLQRMRSAGVDTDKVMENVLAQRCDALAGWWSLLLEKEERKERRKERKRKEKEDKVARRISAASLLKASSLLEGVTEEASERRFHDAAPTTPMRGRKERRSIPNPQLIIPEMPQLPEGVALQTPNSATPPAIDESVRSVSTSRPRPIVQTTKMERRRSRSSTLQLAVAAAGNQNLAQQGGVTKRRNNRRRQLGFLNQLASIKHWFIENTKRARSPNLKGDKSVTAFPNYKDHAASKTHLPPPGGQPVSPVIALPTKPLPAQSTNGVAPVVHRNNRSSLSPAPLTPRSSYRRSSAGLRGRKSTSSSVSSIRSMHHVPTHSKTSSTSSRADSVQSSAIGSRTARSPHTSVKVLPATPTGPSIPSNVRLVRGSPAPIHIPPPFGSSARSPIPFAEPNFSKPLSSPGLVFAKRKRTPFKGPMLGNPGGSRSREGSRSGSVPRRHSRLIIEEEEEEEEEDDEDIEEVDDFSPMTSAVNSPGIDAEAEEGPTLETIGEQQARGGGSSSGWVDFSPTTDSEGGLLPQVMAAGTKAGAKSG